MMKLIKYVFILIMVLSVTAFGQEVTNNIGFAGGRYDSDDGVIFNLGYGKRISGPLFTAGYLDIGLNKNIGAEAFVTTSLSFINDNPIFSNIGIGLLAGPGVDWTGETSDNEEINFTTYIMGAAGGMVYYNITPQFGIFGFGKYKFDFEGENNYVDGWIAGGNLFIRF